MPDHLHIIIEFKEQTVDTLGQIIARYKAAVNSLLNRTRTFAPDFNDQIITSNRDLNSIFAYLRDNARRLHVRRNNPEFFRRKNNITIDDIPCQFYGNLFLFDNPFKDAVIIHRKYTAVQRAALRERWLHTAANGGVLVSPFISPDENEFFKEAIELGGRFIYIHNRPYNDRDKPSKALFELCEQGRMLLIAPTDGRFGSDDQLCRPYCLGMNGLALQITGVEEEGRR